MPYAVGVDIGGTNFRLAVVDETGQYGIIKKFPSEGYLGPHKLIDRVASAVSGIIEEAPGPVAGIGVGIAGAVDHIKGVVRFSPNLPGWENIPLAEIMETRLRRPVLVDNDADLIAFGEKWQGAGREYENFLCITLGTGVGGGLILRNEIWHGCGTAGEIGHVTIDRHGARCNCGNYGCLETVASATGLIRMAREGLGEGKEGLLAQRMASDPEALSARLIADLAGQGDQWALELFAELGKALGVAIASVMNLLCLDVIIIGGGVSDAWDLFIGPLDTEYARRVMPGTRPEAPVLPWALKDAAGIIGAAAAVFNK
ncbi:MAG: ROK family protein [Thermodesulfobacteriota bacterium]